MTPAKIITERIEELGISLRELSRRMGYNSPGLVWEIINKEPKKRVPLDCIDDWIVALEMTPTLGKQFKALVEEQFTPPPVIERLRAVEKMLESTLELSRRVLIRLFPTATEEDIQTVLDSLEHPERFRVAWLALSSRHQFREVSDSHTR